MQTEKKYDNLGNYFSSQPKIPFTFSTFFKYLREYHGAKTSFP